VAMVVAISIARLHRGTSEALRTKHYKTFMELNGLH